MFYILLFYTWYKTCVPDAGLLMAFSSRPGELPNSKQILKINKNYYFFNKMHLPDSELLWKGLLGGGLDDGELGPWL